MKMVGEGNTNELLSGGITNYFESGTKNSWLFSRRIINSLIYKLKREL